MGKRTYQNVRDVYVVCATELFYQNRIRKREEREAGEKRKKNGRFLASAWNARTNTAPSSAATVNTPARSVPAPPPFSLDSLLAR
jgi:hypothetical protein